MLSGQNLLVSPFVMGQVGRLRVGARLQSTADVDEISDRHIGGKRVAARLSDVSLYIDTRRFDRDRISVDQQPVARLQQNVGRGIALKSQTQADAENLAFAIGKISEDLSVFCFCVRRKTTCEMNGITQMYLARGPVGSWPANIAQNRNRRRILKIKAAENSNGVHGMEGGRLLGIRQRSSQIKALNGRVKIRRV